MLLSIFNEKLIFEFSFLLINRINCCFSFSTSVAVELLGTEYITVLSLNSGSEILSIDDIIYLPLFSCLSVYSFHISIISLSVIFFCWLYSSSIFDFSLVISFSFSILFRESVDVSKLVRFISAIGFDFFWAVIFERCVLKTWLWNVETGINLYLIFFFFIV